MADFLKKNKKCSLMFAQSVIDFRLGVVQSTALDDMSVIKGACRKMGALFLMEGRL